VNGMPQNILLIHISGRKVAFNSSFNNSELHLTSIIFFDSFLQRRGLTLFFDFYSATS
jgi:hypothetical protein